MSALISGGADVFCKTRAPQKLTALHLAAMAGHADVAEVLLLAGAAPVVRDGRGRTASYWAAKGGHDDLAARLMPGNWMTPRNQHGPPWRV